ncbi:hypothetical protein, partial [Pseudomonas sp. ST1]|uniref:hypothetical protein n=1 Tax=Pseudomonas sp. ST1 TaxID=2596897 RepID=UPI001C49C76B
MKYKIPFALIVGGIIVFPPITSRIISPSIFMSLGFSEKIAIASYISLTFFVIAAALAVIFVAGVKLSQFSRAGVVELDRINEREEPNICFLYTSKKQHHHKHATRTHIPPPTT